MCKCRFYTTDTKCYMSRCWWGDLWRPLASPPPSPAVRPAARSQGVGARPGGAVCGAWLSGCPAVRLSRPGGSCQALTARGLLSPGPAAAHRLPASRPPAGSHRGPGTAFHRLTRACPRLPPRRTGGGTQRDWQGAGAWDSCWARSLRAQERPGPSGAGARAPPWANRPAVDGDGNSQNETLSLEKKRDPCEAFALLHHGAEVLP